MPRRRVTFEYDPSVRKFLLGDAPMEHDIEQYIEKCIGVNPFSITVEDLPGPPIVEEFVVRVTSPAILGPLRGGIVSDILRGGLHAEHTVEVERRA